MRPNHCTGNKPLSSVDPKHLPLTSITPSERKEDYTSQCRITPFFPQISNDRDNEESGGKRERWWDAGLTQHTPPLQLCLLHNPLIPLALRIILLDQLINL